MSENLKTIYQAVLDGDMGAAQEGVQTALDAYIVLISVC
jgi:hypothetical protein